MPTVAMSKSTETGHTDLTFGENVRTCTLWRILHKQSTQGKEKVLSEDEVFSLDKES